MAKIGNNMFLFEKSVEWMAVLGIRTRDRRMKAW